MKAAQIDTDAVYMIYFFRLEIVAERRIVILAVDCDKRIGTAAQNFFDRIKKDFINSRCALVKMKAMRSVDNFCAAFSCAEGGKARYNGAHRSVAMNDIIAIFVNDFFQRKIRLDI